MFTNGQIQQAIQSKAAATAMKRGILQTGATGNEKSAADVIAELRAQVDKLTEERDELRRKNDNQALTIHAHQMACKAAGLDPCEGVAACISTLTTERDEARKLIPLAEEVNAAFTNYNEHKAFAPHHDDKYEMRRHNAILSLRQALTRHTPTETST